MNNSSLQAKREKRTRHILLSALEAWYKTGFGGLTMDAAAREAGLTKPALYRYFPTKQALLNAIQEYSVQRLIATAADWLQQASNFTPQDGTAAAAALCDSSFTLFSENPHYLHCVTARAPFLAPGSEQQLFRSGHSIMQQLQHWFSPEQSEFLIYSNAFWNKIHFCGDDILGSEKLATNRNWVQQRCLNGLGNCSHTPQIEYTMVEKVFIPQPHEARRQPHRIFSAIEEVVGEVGIADATVQKIADRVGISVSSLYFHFTNRGEMLEQMLQLERETFLSMFEPRIQMYDGTPEEMLYGFYLLLDAYFRFNPQIITVGSWIRSQTVPVEQPNKLPQIGEAFSFINTGIQSGIFAEGLTAQTILVFLRIYLAHHHFILSGGQPGFIRPHADIPDLRRRFQPVLTGISQSYTPPAAEGAIHARTT